MNVEIELQKAVFAALSSAAYRVTDGWYEEESLPLINIGEMEVESGQSKVNENWVLNLAVHTWSEKTSSLEVKQMNYHVRQALAQVELEGYRVGGQLVRTFTLKETQQQTTGATNASLFHGVTFYRFHIMKEEPSNGSINRY